MPSSLIERNLHQCLQLATLVQVQSGPGLLLQVYAYAVNTVLLSFCEDCEQHDGHAQFAPPLLLHALGQAQEQHDRAVAKANDGSVPLDSPTVRTQFISR